MIERDRRGDVGVLTINRPERRNALNLEACVALTDALDEFADARVIVLTGAGGHFCAGADLSGVEGEEFRRSLRVLLDRITTVPVPVLAAIEGAALGAGVQLAVASDLRVATPDARLGVPAAKLGLMVDHWTVQRVAALTGLGAAQAILLTAEEISGVRAAEVGLVHGVATVDEALAWAERLARLAPLSQAGHKLALNRLQPVLDDDDVAEAVRRAWASADVAEGMAAFRERRPPQFRGE